MLTQYNPNWTQRELERIVKEKTARVPGHDGLPVQVEVDGRWLDAQIVRSDVYLSFQNDEGELDIMFFRLSSGRIVHTSLCKWRTLE